MNTQQAKHRRNVGMQRAARRANKRKEGWTDLALSTLRLYLQKHRRQRFLCEDVVEFAKAWIDSAPDNRAWGAVIVTAHREGLIRRTGSYRKARSSHLSPKPVWVAA